MKIALGTIRRTAVDVEKAKAAVHEALMFTFGPNLRRECRLLSEAIDALIQARIQEHLAMTHFPGEP